MATSSHSDLFRGTAVLGEPGLEHEHVPKSLGCISLADQVRTPAILDKVRVEEPVHLHLLGVEQVLSPRSERALDPFADRNGEPCFGPIEQLFGRVLMQELSQEHLPASIADLHREGDTRRNLRYAMV